MPLRREINVPTPLFHRMNAKRRVAVMMNGCRSAINQKNVSVTEPDKPFFHGVIKYISEINLI